MVSLSGAASLSMACQDDSASTVDGLLASSARRFGDRPCLLLEDGECVTYRHFTAQVEALAGAFAELGVEPGSRLAVVLPNGEEILYVWLAAARLGAAMVAINPALADAEIESLLERARPRILIGATAGPVRWGRRRALPVVLAATGTKTAAASDAEGALRLGDLIRGAATADPALSRAEDLLTVLYTSGTTGLAKGVCLSHTSFVLPALEFSRWMKVTPEDRCLGCLPLFHLAGLAFALSAVAAGASLRVTERFSGSRFWPQVRQHGITLVRHLGEMLAVLCKQPVVEDEQHHTLRAVYGGGARQEVAAEIERRFGVAVVEGYGLTETNTVLRQDLDGRLHGSIGRPLPYAEVRIVDAAGIEVAAGVEGEIQVRRNPVMMSGYLDEPQQTARVFAGDWFQTGDQGYRDSAGNFYFVARQRNIIRRRGENIAPAAIEAVLLRHPAVAVAAVVGVADGVGGEEIKAWVCGRPGASPHPRQLVEWCRRHLAEFQVPRYFEVCGELPVTATHKVNKSLLARMGASTGRQYDRLDVDNLSGHDTRTPRGRIDINRVTPEPTFNQRLESLESTEK